MTFSRKKRALAVACLAFAAMTAGAIAYWTTNGTGTGTATTGTAGGVTIVQTASVTGLYPGGPDQSLDLKINNPATGNVFVNTITASVTGTNKVGCDATDFTLTQAATPIAQDLPNGDTAFSGAKVPTIKMINKGTNQDACKSATVNISYSSN